MTSFYECKWIITGNSSNKGSFREEGETTIRRSTSEMRDEQDLKQEIAQGVIDGYLDASKPWRSNPKYLGLTDLKVELGELRVVGD